MQPSPHPHLVYPARTGLDLLGGSTLLGARRQLDRYSFRYGQVRSDQIKTHIFVAPLYRPSRPRRFRLRTPRKLTRSCRCAISCSFGESPVPSRRLRRGGTRASVKPSLAASLSRWSRWPTARTSPLSPTSPKLTRCSGIGVPERAETRAPATAKSAAGSVIRRPPATLR